MHSSVQVAKAPLRRAPDRVDLTSYEERAVIEVDGYVCRSAGAAG